MNTRRPSIVLSLRPALAIDHPALIALLDETFRDTWLPHLSPRAAQAWWSENRASRYVAEYGSAFMVAESGGELAGFIHHRGDFIEGLHVGRRFRRQGVGLALLGNAEQAMRELSHLLSRLETDTFNSASRSFYGACGYREADQYPDQEWDSGLTTVLMTKALGKP